MRLTPSLLALFIAIVPARADDKPRRPNVVIVLSDDQGYGDFSCHGNPVLKTPNLDKLHAQSVRLTDFHVAPMCSPTRGELMSGLDCLHNGAASVAAGRAHIRRNFPTMAEIFHAGGYRTGHFGKWHLGDNYPDLPHQRGFDETIYLLGWGITSMADTWLNDYFDGRFFHNGILQQYKGYCTDIFFDSAMNWMKERSDKKEPFFVYLPTNAPHGPHWVPERYKKLYQGKGPAPFFGMIANIDENMARLDKFLIDNKLRDNTIVIFFNDNGGTASVKLFNAGMRGGKTTYYDGGHRAACFIRWPDGKFGEPRDIDDVTEVQDLMPTLLELCGINAPKGARFDGTSLAGLLKGTQKSLPDRKLVVQYGEQPNGQKLEKWRSAVLWGKWRLVHGTELYDIRADRGQQNDVAGKHPEVLKALRDHYEKWWSAIEPTLDDFVPIVVGSEKANPVTLTAADWAKVYCDNMQNLRQGVARNGVWHILPEREGEYEIALCRWPHEANAAMSAGIPEFKAVDGTLPAGKALAVAKARLKVADLDETKPVSADAKEVVFRVKLKAGQKLPMQSWLLDGEGKELCGSYFAYVKLLAPQR